MVSVYGRAWRVASTACSMEDCAWMLDSLCVLHVRSIIWIFWLRCASRSKLLMQRNSGRTRLWRQEVAWGLFCYTNSRQTKEKNKMFLCVLTGNQEAEVCNMYSVSLQSFRNMFSFMMLSSRGLSYMYQMFSSINVIKRAASSILKSCRGRTIAL